MGIEHGTHFFYGVHVPSEQYQTDNQYRELDMLDGWIKALGFSEAGLGHITAGMYDRHELFLCVVPDGTNLGVEPGEFRQLTNGDGPLSATAPGSGLWSHMIETLARKAGYRSLGSPGWIVAPTEY